MKKNVEPNKFFEVQKYYFVFESMLIFFFSNGHIRSIVSKLPNVEKIDIQNDNVVSTLPNVVQFNVEKHNVAGYFPTFELNPKIYSLNIRINFKCGKIRPRKTPNTDNFYPVISVKENQNSMHGF